MEHYGWSKGEPDTANKYVMAVNVGGWVSMKTANSSVKASYYCNQKPTTLQSETVTTEDKGSHKFNNHLDITVKSHNGLNNNNTNIIYHVHVLFSF